MSLRRVCFALVFKCACVQVCLCAFALVCKCALRRQLGASPRRLLQRGRGVFHLTRHDDEDEKEEVEDAPLLASIVGSSIRFVVFSCNFDSY